MVLNGRPIACLPLLLHSGIASIEFVLELQLLKCNEIDYCLLNFINLPHNSTLLSLHLYV